MLIAVSILRTCDHRSVERTAAAAAGVGAVVDDC
jgi:hypothetical protein